MEWFSLKRKDFQNNVACYVGDLKDSKEFTDVTLACDDDGIFQVHKFMLSAFSPFFENILKKISHPQPFIYLSGLKSSDVESIISFMYKGECIIIQQELNNFFILAKSLQIKGLMESEAEVSRLPDIEEKEEGHNLQNFFDGEPETENDVKRKFVGQKIVENTEMCDFLEGDIKSTEIKISERDKIVAYIDTLKPVLASPRTWSWICNVCQKDMKTKQRLGLHVEVHLDGTSHSCKICGKTYKTKNTLQKHTYISHRKEDK